jgi:hypothetical protein
MEHNSRKCGSKFRSSVGISVLHGVNRMSLRRLNEVGRRINDACMDVLCRTFANFLDENRTTRSAVWRSCFVVNISRMQ